MEAKTVGADRRSDSEMTALLPLTDEQVFVRYSKTVYRLAYARTGSTADADDILQDVFMRYLRRRPELSCEEHRKAWLLKAALNCSKSLLKSPWRKTKPLPEGLGRAHGEKSEVFYAVAELPETMRVVIHLHYYEGYPVAEIAGLLRLTESAVKTRLFRARKLLESKLKGENMDV